MRGGSCRNGDSQTKEAVAVYSSTSEEGDCKSAVETATIGSGEQPSSTIDSQSRWTNSLSWASITCSMSSPHLSVSATPASPVFQLPNGGSVPMCDVTLRYIVTSSCRSATAPRFFWRAPISGDLGRPFCASLRAKGDCASRA